jgi:hypothetical protein
VSSRAIRTAILDVLAQRREDDAVPGEPGDRWLLWLDDGDARLDISALADALVAVLTVLGDERWARGLNDGTR